MNKFSSRFIILCLISIIFSLTIFGNSEKNKKVNYLTHQSSSFRSEDVEYRNGEMKLAAVLLIPESSVPVPGAVIIQGSGKSDRTNQWARAISEVLVKNGVAVLLTDKRGSGQSEGNWQTSNFEDLAQDALAGVKYLLNRKEVDSERIGVVGLSQGGWIAPLAATRSEKIAFVIDISGASVSFIEQNMIEMSNTARQFGLTETQTNEVMELNRAAGDFILKGDWEKYSRLRDQALQSDWKKLAAGFPDAPNLPIWTFLHGVFAYDPIPYWMQLTKPALIMYGEEDEKDNVPVTESVRRLTYAFEIAKKKNYQITIIPGAGHSFIDPQQKELMPSFVESLGSWVKKFVLK